MELQRSLTIQREQSESLRQERDHLQNEVFKLEEELKEHQDAVFQLEGNERRLSQKFQAEDQSKQQEIADLQQEITVLNVGIWRNGMNSRIRSR